MTLNIISCCVHVKTYQRLLRDLYKPREFDRCDIRIAINHGKIEDLVQYANNYPQKLRMILDTLGTQFLSSCMKHEYGYVVLSLEIFRSLLLAYQAQRLSYLLEPHLNFVFKAVIESRNALYLKSAVPLLKVCIDHNVFSQDLDFFMSLLQLVEENTSLPPSLDPTEDQEQRIPYIPFTILVSLLPVLKTHPSLYSTLFPRVARSILITLTSSLLSSSFTHDLLTIDTLSHEKSVVASILHKLRSSRPPVTFEEVGWKGWKDVCTPPLSSPPPSSFLPTLLSLLITFCYEKNVSFTDRIFHRLVMVLEQGISSEDILIGGMTSEKQQIVAFMLSSLQSLFLLPSLPLYPTPTPPLSICVEGGEDVLRTLKDRIRCLEEGLNFLILYTHNPHPGASSSPLFLSSFLGMYGSALGIYTTLLRLRTASTSPSSPFPAESALLNLVEATLKSVQVLPPALSPLLKHTFSLTSQAVHATARSAHLWKDVADASLSLLKTALRETAGGLERSGEACLSLLPSSVLLPADVLKVFLEGLGAEAGEVLLALGDVWKKCNASRNFNLHPVGAECVGVLLAYVWRTLEGLAAEPPSARARVACSSFGVLKMLLDVLGLPVVPALLPFLYSLPAVPRRTAYTAKFALGVLLSISGVLGTDAGRGLEKAVRECDRGIKDARGLVLDLPLKSLRLQESDLPVDVEAEVSEGVVQYMSLLPSREVAWEWVGKTVEASSESLLLPPLDATFNPQHPQAHIHTQSHDTHTLSRLLPMADPSHAPETHSLLPLNRILFGGDAEGGDADRMGSEESDVEGRSGVDGSISAIGAHNTTPHKGLKKRRSSKGGSVGGRSRANSLTRKSLRGGFSIQQEGVAGVGLGVAMAGLPPALHAYVRTPHWKKKYRAGLQVLGEGSAAV
eukprot:gene23801-28825_t